jgi:prolyl-tRNA editing enzyme YbaK/EbsC (Cys-tRNA(Pro) deacylase)
MTEKEGMSMPYERVKNYLSGLEEPIEPFLLEVEMHTAAEAAAALGVEVGQIAKSILFEAGDRYGLFVSAGDVRVDQKKVRQLLGGKVKLALPETVECITGFQVGGVCPFALATDVPVYVDPSLRRFAVVYTAAGVPESLVPINAERLVQLTGATWIPE